MDDYEDPRVRRARGKEIIEEGRIPPEKRGKQTCRDCNGNGGKYVTPANKPNTREFVGCTTCNMHGEVPINGS